MKTAKLWTRNFRLVILASAMGTIGAIAGSFALAFLVFDETGSTLASALIVAIQLLPYLLLPVLIAPLMDRLPRKAFLVAGDLANAILLAGMGLWLMAFDFSYVGYLALSLLLACLGAVDELAFTSIYPELIPEGAEEKGYAVSSMLYPILKVVMTPLAASSSVSDLRQKLQELQSEQEKVNQQLKDAQSNKADAEALKTQLEQQKALILSQISNLSEQIGSLDEEIVNKQDEIDRKQQEVDQKQAEYDQRWADFKDRMRAMQRLNDGGSIALLSSATNLYQLLTFATTLDQIVNKDEDTCQQLENEHAELEQQRAELEQAKADLEATQADLETQKTALDGKTNELAQNISQTDANISAADAEIEANKAALIEANKAVDKAATELDAALNAANQAYGNASIQCSLDFGRPLATYKYVSCYFGGNGHRGTDYAAPGGTEIYAVSGGVVTAAAYHWSWGYYVQVYHGKDDNGNTYSTLYAHMNSAPVVSVGQPVEKGKVLGYVGSTGNSTGNHLHLEMKVNNVLVNVMNYLS